MHVNGTPLAQAGDRRLTESLVYETLRFLGSPFCYDVIGYENIMTLGPAVFIANHLGTIGPITIILSLPIRFYPRIIAEMTDFKRAPRYLYDDFIHPDWHLNGRFGMLVSTLLSQISVRMLNELGCVSVDRTSGWTLEGFRESLSLLEEGKNLLIFPEDPRLPLDPDTLMCPFMSGFVGLSRMYRDAYGAQLLVYPMAVFPGAETIAVGKPEFYNQQGFRRDDIHNFTRIVEEDVHRLYLGLKHGSGLF